MDNIPSCVLSARSLDLRFIRLEVGHRLLLYLVARLGRPHRERDDFVLFRHRVPLILDESHRNDENTEVGGTKQRGGGDVEVETVMTGLRHTKPHEKGAIRIRWVLV